RQIVHHIYLEDHKTSTILLAKYINFQPERRSNAMKRLGKVSIAIILGLTISLTMCTSGVFAQSTGYNAASKAIQTTFTTTNTRLNPGNKQTDRQHSSSQGNGRFQELHCSRGYRPIRVFRRWRWVWICSRYAPRYYHH